MCIEAVAPASRSQGENGILNLLRESEGDRPAEDTALEEEERLAPGIVCRLCGHRVTSDDERIAVDGSHTHAFFNPAGILFEVGCFRLAPGCQASSEASGQFTWFAGYLWRTALCSQCACHLGWRFEKPDSVFFCLILTQLTDNR